MQDKREDIATRRGSRLKLITARDLLALDEGKLWASVSYCTGGTSFINTWGYAKAITRYIYTTREAAYQAKAVIDYDACGGGCENWHVVEEALPHEKDGRAYKIVREEYAAYGGQIPAIFLLPAEREARAMETTKALAKRCRSSETPQVQGSFVYIVLAVGTTRVKIGRSEGLMDRLYALRTGSPFPLKLLREIPTTDPVGLEKYLHRTHLAYRCFGEWFELPAKVLDQLLTEDYTDVVPLTGPEQLSFES